MTDQNELFLLQQKLILKEKEIELQEGLPFLHGWKWYKWARDFYESTNRQNFLTAANQASKSSTQIRKCINWATDQSLWPELWSQKPNQFWYFYPSMSVADIEFEKKWKQFLPQGKFKDDPVYGWTSSKKDKHIHQIDFKSGVTVYFKSYKQNETDLQTGTVFAMFCDEEMPVDLYDELSFRLSATDGYFHMVFTATLGQDFWRLVMEPESHEEERFPDAFKLTISLYDCQFYEDGSRSHWSDDKIKRVIARCSSHQEVLRRVFGKFIRESGGLKYPTFDVKRHMKTPHPVPKDWMIYVGADPGSGGVKGHPSSLAYVAVSPDLKKGRVIAGWRGDGIPTTAGDLVEKHIAIKKEMNFKPVAQFYDWASKDFQEIASRMGETFLPAEKSHEKGEDIINTLFKYDMLAIYETDDLKKLAVELVNLQKDRAKNKCIDDLADAMRYAVTRIPWDFSWITGLNTETKTEKPKTDLERQIDERRKAFTEEYQEQVQSLESEFSEWNDAYGS